MPPGISGKEEAALRGAFRLIRHILLYIRNYYIRRRHFRKIPGEIPQKVGFFSKFANPKPLLRARVYAYCAKGAKKILAHASLPRRTIAPPKLRAAAKPLQIPPNFLRLGRKGNFPAPSPKVNSPQSLNYSEACRWPAAISVSKPIFPAPIAHAKRLRGLRFNKARKYRAEKRKKPPALQIRPNAPEVPIELKNARRLLRFPERLRISKIRALPLARDPVRSKVAPAGAVFKARAKTCAAPAPRTRIGRAGTLERASRTA